VINLVNKELGGHCMCCLSNDVTHVAISTTGCVGNLFVCNNCLKELNNAITKHFKNIKNIKGLQNEKN